MEQIQFDSGMACYQVNDQGFLRFNPADPNIYARFLQLSQKIGQIEQEMTGEESAAQQLQIADAKIKELLGWVFGPHNDFHALLGGVSVLAVAANGQRVLNNLLQALEPILLQGAQTCARDLTRQAQEAARQRKEQC